VEIRKRDKSLGALGSPSYWPQFGADGLVFKVPLPSRKSPFCQPRERQALIFHLLLDDPPVRLLHNRVAASMKLRKQRRFTAARISGNDDKSIQAQTPATRMAQVVNLRETAEIIHSRQ